MIMNLLPTSAKACGLKKQKGDPETIMTINPESRLSPICLGEKCHTRLRQLLQSRYN